MMSSERSIGSGMAEGVRHLSLEYQKRLDPLIGVLSRFITEKAFNRCMERGNGLELDLDRTIGMIDEISEDARLLIGPMKAKGLKEEMIRLTKDYYQEDE